MQNDLNRRRAIGILVVLGAILVVIAGWRLGDNESF
jgi:hypothetical protein